MLEKKLEYKLPELTIVFEKKLKYKLPKLTIVFEKKLKYKLPELTSVLETAPGYGSAFSSSYIFYVKLQKHGAPLLRGGDGSAFFQVAIYFTSSCKNTVLIYYKQVTAPLFFK